MNINIKENHFRHYEKNLPFNMTDRFYLRKESKMRKKRKELFLEKFYLRKEIFTTGTLKILKAQRVPYIVKPENSKSAKR